MSTDRWQRATAGFVALGFLLALLTPAFASERNGGGCGGWGARSPYDQLFDPEAVIQVSGEIRSLSTFEPRPGMVPGVRFDLHREKEVFSVHMGPEWYLETLDLRLENGAWVELRASIVAWEDDFVLMVVEASDGKHRATLREESGFPVWSRAGAF